MKIYAVYLPIIIVLCCCTQLSEPKEISEVEDTITTPKFSDTVVHDLIDTVVLETPILKECNCKTTDVDFNWKPQLSISSYKYHLDSFKDWSEEDKLNITSLRLAAFDTIPNELEMFKNVETLTLGRIDWLGVSGIEMFPKLKNLNLMGKQLDLRHQPKWLNRIEVFHAQKSTITGLESFGSMPNLKMLKFQFSAFDEFPADFESLSCLQYFQIGAYTNGKVDLSTIDLSEMPCLKFAEFHSWHKNLSGIPTGINRIKTLKVHHDNLTDEENATLKARRPN